MPQPINDLAEASAFLRAASATQAGSNRGLAIRCAKPAQGAWAGALLSTLGTSLALRIEVRLPDPGHTALHRVAGLGEWLGQKPPGEGARRPSPVVRPLSAAKRPVPPPAASVPAWVTVR